MSPYFVVGALHCQRLRVSTTGFTSGNEQWAMLTATLTLISSNGVDLLDVVTVKVVPGLAAVDPSGLGILVPEPEPACEKHPAQPQQPQPPESASRWSPTAVFAAPAPAPAPRPTATTSSTLLSCWLSAGRCTRCMPWLHLCFSGWLLEA